MQTQPIDRIFTALADAGRRAMVERLSAGPASATQLAAPSGMRLPSALKHLKVLEEGGIVLSEKSGRTRTYRIQEGAISAIGGWVRDREAAWSTAFDRLASAMEDLPEEEPT